MADALGISKALASRFAKRGMPLTSPQAAQAWRETNAPPRQWKSKSSAPRPATAPPSKASTTPAAVIGGDPGDTPAESLRRARSAERESYRHLERLHRDKSATAEDIRKGNSTYVSARNNRAKAEADHREYLRAESITLFFDEAKDLAGRPHEAARNLLATAAKSLAVRCVGQPQKSIETVIGDWIDRLTETLRASL